MLPCLPSAGIVEGEGLGFARGQVDLDERQRVSLERQLLILYVGLAEGVAGDRLPSRDHERALEYLASAAAELAVAEAEGEDPLRGHGKRARALRALLERVVPPSLLAALARSSAVGAVSAGEQPAGASSAPGEPEPPAPEPAASGAEASIPAAPAQRRAPREPASPEQRLLAAIHEQLRWARAHHEDLLDELLLNHLRISPTGSPELARLERHGLVINAEHPIIARLLGQDPHDPIDLAFSIAALYSLLNYEADEISDDDERLFVAQLAESLALSQRAARGESAQRGP